MTSLPSLTIPSGWPSPQRSRCRLTVVSQPYGGALEGAAASDPEARRLHTTLIRQRRRGMQEAAQLFADAGALRSGIDADVAAALMWLYNA